MKNYTYIGLLLALLCTSHLFAFEIEQHDFLLPGEPEQSPKLFLKTGGKLIILPTHLVYKSSIFNETRTLAAVNFHGVSNYDGIDLVVNAGSDKVVIVPNIWLLIKDDLVKSGIISSSGFDHTYLEATKLQGNRVYCKIFGTNAKENLETTKAFSLICNASQSELSLRVEK